MVPEVDEPGGPVYTALEFKDVLDIVQIVEISALLSSGNASQQKLLVVACFLLGKKDQSQQRLESSLEG